MCGTRLNITETEILDMSRGGPTGLIKLLSYDVLMWIILKWEDMLQKGDDDDENDS